AMVLLFTFTVSIIAGLLFGVIPVLKYAGAEVAAGLRGGGRSSSASRDRHRARSMLVVVQVALALVLLVSAGLMIRTFESLRHVYPGFARPEEMLTFRLSIPSAQVKDADAVVRMHQAIADRIAAMPGVASVGMTSILPMTGQGWHDPIFAADKTYAERQLPPIRLFKFVSPGLLKTMGTPILAGRDFTWEDAYDRRPVAIVSEALARELWGQPPAAIGKQIRETNNSLWREVVGVVGDERDDGLDKPAPAAAYWPMLMAKFEDGDPSVRRTISYVIRSRRRVRSRRGARAHAADDVVALRGEPDRSADVRRGVRGARRHRARRELSARAARDARESRDGAASRIAWRVGRVGGSRPADAV